ncbi:MAG: hypothetical protein M3O85_01385 [Acidobacteriota bacterium]|nr:hypothetical protein [Acidobacteriota bacterium]
MKSRILSLAFLLLCGSLSAAAAALGTSTRSAIPSEVQQIIVVDYRAFNDSASARALKERMTTTRLRQFEAALRRAGIVPEREVEQLTFASFRSKGQSLQTVGIAEGSFTREAVVHRLQMKGIRPQKGRLAPLYPMEGSMVMTFLDDSALLFGEPAAVRLALAARQGEIQSVNSNAQISELLNGMGEGAVWSVMDGDGTRNMVRSALGESSQLTNSAILMKRLRGARYTADFSRGCEFSLDILTSDSFTAATLSSLFQAAMVVRKLSAKGGEKIALESLSVESDGDKLKAHFQSDQERFQALLKSDLFATISK